MITKFNTQLFDISMNSYTLANTAGANGQISYNYETGKLYVHDGFGNKFSNTLVQAGPTISQMQGSSYGYSAGGGNQSGIDLYPFASETTTSVGPTALTYPSGDAASNSSRENGYSSGPVYGTQTVIQKVASPLASSSIDV